MPLVLAGATSGSATVQATDAQTVTITLPATSGTLAVGGTTPSFSTLTVTGNTNLATSSGSVGIGTSGPVTNLQINASSDVGVSMSNSSSVTSGNRGTISMFNSGTSTVGYIRFGAVTDNVGTDIQFGVRPAAGSATEAMRITSDGNVGIGTTNPSSGASGGITRILNLRTGSTAGTSSLTFGDTNAVATVEAMNGASCVLNINAGATITFGTNAPTERMRIDSSGRVLVGTTASQPGYGNTNTGVQLATSVSNFSTNTTDWVQTVNQNGSDSGARYLIGFRVSNGQVGNIQSNGSNCTFNSTSDYRLKENVAPLTGALNRISQLKPVTYNWKLDGSAGEGFIAHELQTVVPECVTGEKDAMRTEKYEISPAIPATYDEEDNELTPAVEAVMGEREVPAYQGVDTSFLVATLTAAIQELKATVDAQAARIAVLEGAK
jgi:hypothetical protein